MIASLNGQVISLIQNHFVIDVGGVGYLVYGSHRTLGQLPAIGQCVQVFIQTQVRAESIELFGFCDPLERDLFNVLLTVQGVGTRVALAIQSALAPQELASAIQRQDKAVLMGADGVGPKLAARLLVELKDKIQGFVGALPPLKVRVGNDDSQDKLTRDREDVVAVLIRLGYRRPEVLRAVQTTATSDTATVEQWVKDALQHLTRNNNNETL